MWKLKRWIVPTVLLLMFYSGFYFSAGKFAIRIWLQPISTINYDSINNYTIYSASTQTLTAEMRNAYTTSSCNTPKHRTTGYKAALQCFTATRKNT
jgi:hypothetical protein